MHRAFDLKYHDELRSQAKFQSLQAKFDNIQKIQEESKLKSQFSATKLSEFKDAFKEFADKNGEITYEGFQKVLKQMGLEDEEFLKNLFSVWDTDDSGSLNYREFMSALSLLSPETTPHEKLKFTFQLYDVDHSGYLEREELKKVLQLGIITAAPSSSLSLSSSSNFGTDSSNKPLKVSLRDSLHILQSKIETLFEQMDADHDGRISFEEFEKAALEHKLFVDGPNQLLDLISQIGLHHQLQEKAAHSPGLLRIKSDSSPFHVSRFTRIPTFNYDCDSDEEQDNNNNHHHHKDGFDMLDPNDKHAQIAIVQLLKPDFSFQTLEHFYTMFEQLGATQGLAPKWLFEKAFRNLGIEDKTFVDHLFKVWDTDGDGMLDYKEFLLSMCSLSKEGTNEDKLRFAFRMFDMDNNGTIDKKEFIRVIKLLKKTTSVKAGKKEEEDIESQAEKLFARINSNNSGKISFDEFKQAFQQEESLLIQLPDVVNLLENLKSSSKAGKHLSANSLKMSGWSVRGQFEN